ncbi:hypothetical protein PLESTB_000318300 [Pleodorina starrii]|uniref:SET domain-containing protein n=1 Tax=Pleodorina starrii TaxID=330485 RepID=A0A9W6EZ93_9CHLO|nr:hypothetical protein PLESTM_001740000 [Pleodorina starrii]GLC49876.1 hypothetical protein PLESTB_000318300 [Pleodorina starrii]GLC68254.1 hypothetical protein PLESTF_000667100 [Pleodorina starrii]
MLTRSKACDWSAASATLEKDDFSCDADSALSYSRAVESTDVVNEDSGDSSNSEETTTTTAAGASSGATSSPSASSRATSSPIPSASSQPPLPRWESQRGRPGYMDLADAVAYKNEYGIKGLPRCWGPGLLGHTRVYCNTVYRGKLAKAMDAVRDDVAKGNFDHYWPLYLSDPPLADVIQGDMKDDLWKKCRRSLRRLLRAAVLEAILERMDSGEADRIRRLGDMLLTPAKVLANLPEIIPISEKVERVYIGEAGDDDDTYDTYWDDNPAMKGQTSLRVKPGCELAEGEVIGVYSGEVWFDWDYPTIAEPNGTDEWDDTEHPSPYPYGTQRLYEFDRYACEGTGVIHERIFTELVNRSEQFDGKPFMKRIISEDGTRARKLVVTAARLGCPMAAANDPRRNINAKLEQDANFRDGGANATVRPARVCGILPLFVMFAVKPIKAREHVTYDYTCGYWQLHSEREAACREIEKASAEAAEALRGEPARLLEAATRYRSSTPKKQQKKRLMDVQQQRQHRAAVDNVKERNKNEENEMEMEEEEEEEEKKKEKKNGQNSRPKQPFHEAGGFDGDRAQQQQQQQQQRAPPHKLQKRF